MPPAGIEPPPSSTSNTKKTYASRMTATVYSGLEVPSSVETESPSASETSLTPPTPTPSTHRPQQQHERREHAQEPARSGSTIPSAALQFLWTIVLHDRKPERTVHHLGGLQEVIDRKILAFDVATRARRRRRRINYTGAVPPLELPRVICNT
ncbi:hypothetical protein DFH06DRAFT_1130340 [Mycena polygramma]|nr:hypothetical protein DFH06DRAFT_1130340 [Mycena polygramma]